MANRRLAPHDEQPPHFAFTAENENWAAGQIAKYPEGREASAVIPLLWRAQEQAGGWLPQKAIEAVADRLGMPYIRVLEVATFYTMFALEPVGRYWIQVCGTVPCDSCGARELKDMLHARLGPPGHVSADGNFSWLEVECLGACCNAPMAQINQDYYEDLTPENLGRLLDDLAAGRPVKRGSQVGRVSSEPEGAVNTLQDASLYDGSRVGAWRKRFEEAAVQPATPSAAPASEGRAREEAESTDKRAATDPKAAQPHVGRANQEGRTDAPAQRASAGEAPTDPGARERQSAPERPTAAPATSGPEEQPGPQSAKSYTATPSNPDAGRPVADAHGTSPEAGTPTSAEPPRRSGAEAVPVGADARTGLPPGPTDPKSVAEAPAAKPTEAKPTDKPTDTPA